MIAVIRWDEKAGLRRDAVRSQVIDVLQAQEIKGPAMKKVSAAAAKQMRNFSEQRLTIGLDLGDRSSSYCMLDESGSVMLEQRLSTTAKAIQEVFGAIKGGRMDQGAGVSKAGQEGWTGIRLCNLVAQGSRDAQG